MKPLRHRFDCLARIRKSNRAILLIAASGIVLAMAGPSAAQDMWLDEPFNYSDSSALSGQNGGVGFNTPTDAQWTGSWSGSSSFIMSTFNPNGYTGQSNMVTANTGGATATISRPFSLNTSGSRSLWFSTNIIAGNANDTALMGFTDGSKAYVGIKNGQFYAELNGVAATQAGTVLANTPYRVTGEILFDSAGNETLNLWANDKWWTNTGNQHGTPLTSVSTETSATNLGSNVALVANSTSPVMMDGLAMGNIVADTMRIDFGSAAIQPGYQYVDPTSTMNFTAFGGASLNITGDNLRVVSQSVAGATYGDLIDQLLTTDSNTMELHFSNLDCYFGLKMYHDSLTYNTAAGPLKVYLETATGDQLLATVMPTQGASIPASTEIFFPEVNHEATLKIVAPYGAYPVVNGFEMVPEPGTWILLSSGLLALGIWRLRRRVRR